MDLLGGMDLNLARNLLIAVSIGALIGVERERRHAAEPSPLGGVRTFTLIGMAGALSTWLSAELGSLLVLGASALCLSALLVASYLSGNRKDVSSGTTTEVAGLITFLLGATVMAGHPEVAVVLAVVVTSLLAFKAPLHDAVGKLSAEDIQAGLKLLFATFVILPVLPNKALDPWDALVPYKLWALVVLISGISMVGYVATRVLGHRRGIPLTGLTAGLVSSTALTVAFSRRSRETPELSRILGVGVLLSWTVMFVRVFIEALVVAPGMVVDIAVPMLTAAITTGAVGAVTWRREARDNPEDSHVDLVSPFSLSSAIRFAAFYAGVLLLVALARRYLDERWLYAIAAVAGLTDVDAITLSMARVASQHPEQTDVAVRAIVVAVCSNTLVKTGMVWAMGDQELRRRIALATLALLGSTGLAVAAVAAARWSGA